MIFPGLEVVIDGWPDPDKRYLKNISDQNCLEFRVHAGLKARVLELKLAPMGRAPTFSK